MNIEVYNAVGGAAFFQGLLDEWRAAGERVTCRQAVTETAYRSPRGPLGRLALRWQMYAGHGWRCWSGARREADPTDLRVVATNPFFAPALVARAGRGRVPTINLLFDLYPEALVQTGRIGADSWLARRCAGLTRYALRECAATVFLGERLRAYTEAAHGPARRAAVIPVGAEGAPFRHTPPIRAEARAPLRMFYSGQLGRMHDSGTLLAAWEQIGSRRSDLAWVFHASGAGYARLRRQAGEQPGVEWGGALPAATWVEEMKRAQVALITVAPGAERVVMPSKTYSAMVAGQALLAICPRQSDLADLVQRHDCGWVVEPGDVAAFLRVLEHLHVDSAELHEKRCNSYEAGHRFYDVRPVGAQWLELMHDLRAGKHSPSAIAERHETAV